MAKHRSVTKRDTELFRKTVGRVRRVTTDKVTHHGRKPSPHPMQRRKDEQRVLQEMMDLEYDPSVIQPEDMLSYCRPGVQKSVLRKLKRGHYSITVELDLHGLTAETAHQDLKQFLQHSRGAGLHCVRIIHGKGYRSNNKGPVLKPLVDHWLRRRDDVLAFCSARPIDGGTGAVYVLLKRL